MNTDAVNEMNTDAVIQSNESKIAHEKWDSVEVQEERWKSVKMQMRKYSGNVNGITYPANNSVNQEMNFHSALRATLVARNIIKD